MGEGGNLPSPFSLETRETIGEITMKFRLLSGKHRVQGGKLFLAGDVIETNTDLSVLFRNKFVRVTEDQPVAKPVTREALLDKQASAPKKDEDDDDDAQVSGEEVVDNTPDAGQADDDDLIAGASAAPKKTLAIKAIRGSKLFNVVDEDGNAVNDKPLSRAKAMKMAYPEE